MHNRLHEQMQVHVDDHAWCEQQIDLTITYMSPNVIAIVKRSMCTEMLQLWKQDLGQRV